MNPRELVLKLKALEVSNEVLKTSLASVEQRLKDLEELIAQSVNPVGQSPKREILTVKRKNAIDR